MERGDAEQFIALHEDMAYEMPPQAPMFLIKDDVAWSMGTYMIKSTPKNGDPPSVMDGKFLTILRKHEGEGWKIYRDCYNSNQAPSM